MNVAVFLRIQILAASRGARSGDKRQLYVKRKRTLLPLDYLPQFPLISGKRYGDTFTRDDTLGHRITVVLSFDARREEI